MTCDVHVFGLGDDAVCDVCGTPKYEVVDMDEYRATWALRLDNTCADVCISTIKNGRCLCQRDPVFKAMAQRPEKLN